MVSHRPVHLVKNRKERIKTLSHGILVLAVEAAGSMGQDQIHPH